jgi:hypothetical protein
MKNSLKHWLRRKHDQILNLKKWLPIIWNKYDWDYSYSLNVFKRALLDQAEFMESDRAYNATAKDDAKRIRTIVKLMDKVYDDEYGMEYFDQLKEKYGDDALDFVWEETDDDEMVSFKFKYQLWDNADEIRKHHRMLMNKAMERQKKAERLLWALVEHNIRRFWD